jgi:flagellar FliL protein
MSTEAKSPEPTPAAKAKSKLPLMVIGGALAVGLGAGGWLLSRHKAEASQPDQAQATPSSEVKAVMHLESFVVNLQGTSDNGYLRVGIDLGVATEIKEGEKQTASTGRLRDAILTVLGTRTVDELVTPEGKAKLKVDILQAINERMPELQCREVYFTEFLVQH